MVTEMLRRLRNAFVSGLLLIAPVGVTIFVVNFLIQTIGVPTRQLFFFFIPSDQSHDVWIEYGLYVGAVVIVVVLITLLGWLSKRLIGRALVNFLERIVNSRSGTLSSSNRGPSSKKPSSWSIRAREYGSLVS
jgi:uncharacterized membrane protein